MFTNPFNRKYQTGGSAPTDDQKKEMQGFVTWIKSNIEGFKDKSEQEIAKSLSDMAKSDEGKKSVQDLYSRYQKSKKQKSKFEDGGKFQDFICKHRHGGNVDCGCGGMVVRAAKGIDDIPTPKDSTVTDNGYVIYKPSVKEVAPNGESVIITYGHDPNGQWARRMEWTNGGTSILGGYNNNGQWVSEGDVTYGPTSEFAKAFLNPKVRMSNYSDRPQSKQEGGELTRKQARILSGHNKGFNRSQFQIAMANADAALRKEGLSGKELRQAKRKMVAGINDRQLAINSPLNISNPTLESPTSGLIIKPREDNIRTVSSTIISTNSNKNSNRNVDSNIARPEDYQIKEVKIPIISTNIPFGGGNKTNTVVETTAPTESITETKPLHLTPRPEDTIMYPATPGVWTTMTPVESMQSNFMVYPIPGAAEWGQGGIYETDSEGNRIIKDEGNGVYWTRNAEGKLEKHEPVVKTSKVVSAPKRTYTLSGTIGNPWNIYKCGGKVKKMPKKACGGKTKK